jgi:hypothetical protein
VCNGCGINSIRLVNKQNLHCVNCKADYCKDCMWTPDNIEIAPPVSKIGMKVRQRCDKGHVLQMFNKSAYSGGRGFICNDCKKRSIHMTNLQNLHCKICRDDYCKDCMWEEESKQDDKNESLHISSIKVFSPYAE